MMGEKLSNLQVKYLKKKTKKSWARKKFKIFLFA